MLKMQRIWNDQLNILRNYLLVIANVIVSRTILITFQFFFTQDLYFWTEIGVKF